MSDSHPTSNQENSLPTSKEETPPFTVERYGSFGAAIMAENRWLRAALQKLDNGYKYPTEVCQIARAALSGEPPVRSRSVQRREAAMRGEPAPDFSHETSADSEVEAWLFHCWKPGTHSVFASVDKEDNSWWPLSEWKGVERTPLVRGAAPELIHGERMPRAGHIYSPREGSNVCFICGFHKREHAPEHLPPSPLKAGENLG